MGRLEELRGRIRERGQRFDDLTISEFCDIMWSRAIEVPAMADPSKWREAVYEAFYGEDEIVTVTSGEIAGVRKGIPANAQQALERMREIRRRNMERRTQPEAE